MSDFISREAVLVQIRVQQSRYVLGSREWLAIANALDAIAALPVEQPCVSCSDEQQCAAYQRGVVAGKRGLPVEQPATSAEREKMAARLEQSAIVLEKHAGFPSTAQLLHDAARLLRLPVERDEDAERLDYLEREMEVEKHCIAKGIPYPDSLFRKNMPITRTAIDAARRDHGK